MQVSFGALGCRELEVALAELKRLIALAADAGIPTTSAQEVYDRLDEYVLFLPFGDQCSRDTAEANATANRLRSALSAAGTRPPEPLRPDYVPSEDVNLLDPDAPSLVPSWLKYVAVVGVSAYLLSQVVPLSKLFGGRKKLAGYRRGRRR
jgi:hypothetical protein